MKKIIFLIACFATVVFKLSAQERIVLDQVIAIVGDEMIKKSDIENQIYQIQVLSGGKTQSNPCELFEELLIQKILLNQAALDSVVVSETEVEKELSRRVALFSGDDGLSKFEALYGKTELEIRADWKPLIRDQIVAQRAQHSIVGNVEISPNEIKKFAASLPVDSFPKVPASYEYAEIVFKAKPNAEEEAAIRKKLEDIRTRALNGESFAKLAVLYSDDTESAKQGGLLGDFVSRGDLVPEFSAVAFRLKEGEISRVVKTNFGYHIIQVVEIKGEKIKARHILLRPKASFATMQETMQRADSVYRKLKADSLTFEKAVQLFSTDSKSRYNAGRVMNPYTGTAKFEAEMLDPTMLYTLRSLQVGEISAPFISYDETGTQVYKIVKLTAINPEHTATLQSDYTLIKEMALNNKRNTIFAEWLTKKQERTFIKLPPSEFRNCNFKHKGWIK
ncbi:MAG: peptidylprolyl isomerase [Bacteroidales bacterium]|jgi:peptidyl-prolyl cis-trans isomerase SurA|nr:peptidylprolyl isomerase [Bacteroidales bacterium]